VTYVFALDGREIQLPEVVGGKAVGLSLLARHEVRVPAAFALGTNAYREFVADQRLRDAIRGLVDPAETPTEQASASMRIAALFEDRALQGPLRAELAVAYAELGTHERLPVAVRSSAIGEDAARTSFAGGHRSYLGIRGADAVAEAVVRCWASLFTPQALAYFRRLGLRADEAAMGVVVQTMVAAEAAGVMFTIDPVTGDPSQIAIEACLGLGTAVVGGDVTPDRYYVDKVTLEIRARALGTGERGCLADAQAVELAGVGKRVERALGAPQDLEWAIAAGTRELFMLQTRPETVWSAKRTPTVA
jgi:pyruvate, water dikinase